MYIQIKKIPVHLYDSGVRSTIVQAAMDARAAAGSCREAGCGASH